MGKHYRKGEGGRLRIFAFAALLLAVAVVAYAAAGYQARRATSGDMAIAKSGDVSQTSGADTAAEIPVAGASDESDDADAEIASEDTAPKTAALAEPPREPHAQAPKPAQNVKKTAVAAPKQPKKGSSGSVPLMAIIVDDGGEQTVYAARVAALDIPLTWAIMPYRQYSKENAELARSKGIPYLLHLPMQAESDKDGSQSIISKGMSADEVRSKTAAALDSLPGAIGLNNHRGSLATSDAKLMEPLMQELKERGLIFIDSRTSTNSIAYQTAEAAGVPSLKNRAFLDNVADKSKIAACFRGAAANAGKTKYMIAICHFRPATVAFLEELNRSRSNLPVRLVTIPEMMSFAKSSVQEKD